MSRECSVVDTLCDVAHSHIFDIEHNVIISELFKSCIEPLRRHGRRGEVDMVQPCQEWLGRLRRNDARFLPNPQQPLRSSYIPAVKDKGPKENVVSTLSPVLGLSHFLLLCCRLPVV